jgi:hypothetical protein
MYLQTLEDTRTGFARITTHQLLRHLWQTYGTIKADDLHDNMYALTTLHWNVTDPIESLFQAIMEKADFARAGEASLPESSLVQALYKAVERTGIYAHYCQQWRDRPAADKTLPQAKAFFLSASQDLNQTTAAQMGYRATAPPAATVNATSLQAAAVKEPNNPAVKEPNNPRLLGYCWTHGVCYHTSSSCKKPGTGHQVRATVNHRMGGSEQLPK